MNKLLTFIKYLLGFILAFYVISYGFHFLIKVGMFFFYIGLTIVVLSAAIIAYQALSFYVKLQKRLKRNK